MPEIEETPIEESQNASCNPGGPCVAWLDIDRVGYVDPKWRDHLLMHAREAQEKEAEALHHEQ